MKVVFLYLFKRILISPFKSNCEYSLSIKFCSICKRLLLTKSDFATNKKQKRCTKIFFFNDLGINNLQVKQTHDGLIYFPIEGCIIILNILQILISLFKRN